MTTSPPRPVASAPTAARRSGLGPPSVPPPSVPATFLWLAAAGLIGFGLVLALAADRLPDDPRSSAVLSAVHLGLLAFLSTAVLGALHQFGPVVGARPLRSVAVARVTAVTFFAGAVLLPTGFAHGPEWLVPTGGLLAFTGIVLAAWNLSRPLAAPAARQATIPGLRLSVTFLVITALFGIVYAFDRHTAWFPLYSNRVMAHAHLGLLGWLGLTYVAVAEKLWPMFLLSHRPTVRAGRWAVALIATGVALLAPGLLFGLRALAITGAVITIAGLAAHFLSFVGVVRHRRRKPELLHAFVLAGFVSLAVAIGCGIVAGLVDVDSTTRAHLTSAEIAGLFGWITCAVVGHSHKIIPFLGFGVMRGRGYAHGPDGGPLLFAHFLDHRLAITTFLATVAAVALLLAGSLVGVAWPVAVSGVCFLAVGVLLMVNLGRGPRRLTRALERAPVEGGVTA